MAKGNRVNGVGGRYDFGESGYIDNLRRKSEKPSLGQLSPVGWKLCSRCNSRKPAKGGKGGFGKPFVCASCTAPNGGGK